MRVSACWHKWEKPFILWGLLYDMVVYYGIGFGFFTIGWDRDAQNSDFEATA